MNLSPEIVGESLPQKRLRQTHRAISRQISQSSSSIVRLVNFRGEFQDAESLLSTQMLVAAIILSIVVTIHTGTFSHDALVAGDVRHATFDHVRGKAVAGDTYARFISGRLLVHGYVAVSSSTLSLILAAMIYVSLILSGSRGDDALFKRWWRFGRIWIVLIYLLVVVSIIYFLKLNHDSVYMVYPKYNWNADFSFALETGADSARRLASAAGTTAVGSGTVSYASDSGDRHFGKDVSEMSRQFKFGMNVVLVICSVSITVGHLVVCCWYKKPEQTLQCDTSVNIALPSTPNGSTMYETLRTQIRLLQQQNVLLRQVLQTQHDRASWADVDMEAGMNSEKFLGQELRRDSGWDAREVHACYTP